mmetsp:Transcript_32273/g.51491  ORF Transcript_32273/g.51491 Transcript_32273/m.51491 type:complete len:136 (+) Transcript_32273:4863-5270(+)
MFPTLNLRTQKNQRAYPLQVVYISMVGEAEGFPSDSSSSSKSFRLLGGASKRNKKPPTKRSAPVAVPKVENLILWFKTPTHRREIYDALTSASKKLKKKREQLAKMQNTRGGVPLIVEESNEQDQDLYMFTTKTA